MSSVGGREFVTNKIIPKSKSNMMGKRGQLNNLSLNCGCCQSANCRRQQEVSSVGIWPMVFVIEDRHLK